MEVMDGGWESLPVDERGNWWIFNKLCTQRILANVSLNLLETHEWLVGHQLVLNDWLGRMSIRDLGVINTISYLYHLLGESKNISYEEEEEIGM